MSSIRTARYFDVLALPNVPLTFGAALVGRSAYALVILPLLYAVSEATGSVALAGVAVAIYGATASFPRGSPRRKGGKAKPVAAPQTWVHPRHPQRQGMSCLRTT